MRLPRPPRSWPIAVLACVFVLRLLWPDPSDDAGFAFEVTADSPQVHLMQVYYQKDDARGLSEPASVRVLLDSAEPAVHRFPLPAGTYHALRLDPMQTQGVARFSAARVVDLETGATRCELPVASWNLAQHLVGVPREGGILELHAPEGPIDPIVEIPLPEKPMILRHAPARRGLLLVLAAATTLLLFALGERVLPPVLARAARAPRLRAALESASRGVRSVVPHEVLPIDRHAALFLILVGAGTCVAAALGFHGSSMTARARTEFPPGDWQPLLGTPKDIRADEWNVQTPIMLHQVNRADRLAIPSVVGPENTILIANAPVWHWTAAFRPQLWPFFVLSPARAFAAYWQAKNLFLLAGTFLVFLLLTRSSLLAALGSVWFHLSSYTQWAFSWPAPLPEMIGVMGLAVVAGCLVFVTPSRGFAALLGLLIVGCGVNFMLVSYPPFQVPIGWAGAGLWAAWMTSRTFVDPDAPPVTVRWIQGAIVLACAVALIAAATLLFMGEIRSLVEITRQTLYPGDRSLPGGGVAWTQLVSAFVDVFKTESYSPPQFMNICEGSGYLWLAPITLVLAPRLLGLVQERGLVRAYLVLWIPALALAGWMLLPIPASAGRLLLLDKVMGWRVTPALGLLNIALTLIFVRLTWEHRATEPRPSTVAGQGALAAATITGLLGLLFWMNRELGGFFSPGMLVAGAVTAGAAALALSRGAIGAAAVLLLAPLLAANLLINPVDRGLAVFEESKLRGFIQQHPACKEGRWLVISEDTTAAQYFAALGLNVFNTLHFVPPLDDWAVFDPDGSHRHLYNGSGMAVVRALPPDSASRIEPIPGAHLGPPIIKALSVALDDPGLRRLGIRYIAVHRAALPEGLSDEVIEPLSSRPIDGYALFRLRDP